MGSQGSSETTQVSSLSKDQQKVSKQLSTLLQGQLGKPLEQYQGQRTADLTQPFQDVQQSLDQGFDIFDSRLDEKTQQVISDILQGEASFDLSPETTADRFQKAVKEPLLRTFDEDIAPRINEGFAGQGATFSSRRGDSQRKALEGLQTQMSAQLAETNYQNQALQAQLAESATNRQLQGVGLGQQFASKDINRANLLLQTGAPFQQRQQDMLNANYQEFLRTRPENSPYLQGALAYTGQSHQNTLVEPYQPSFMDQFLGGTLMAAGSAAGSILGGNLPGIGSGQGGGIGGSASSIFDSFGDFK